MTDVESKHKQRTRPVKGKPIEIPIPTREAVIRDLMKVAPRVEPDKPDDES
jgi:hypothetical protein